MRFFKGLLLAASVAFCAGQATAGDATVEVADGVKLAYHNVGDGDQAVILIHGYSFSKEIWHKVEPLLSDDFTVYAYDLRGFGGSSKTDDGYDYPSMVADLSGFMAALDIASAILAGHSLGGTFIQDFAAAHPDKVDGLVLANAQARNKPPLGMNDRFRARIDAWADA